MVEARVGIRVADDRQSVTIEIGSTAEQSETVVLNIDQLTQIIRLMGQARARMIEGDQKRPLDGKTVETVIEPPWYIQVAQIDGSLLAFDHPSYGPLAFAVPRADVVRIVDILSKHLAHRQPQQEKPS
jgi:hypothetical protein